nr:HupE/UreJ family protein [Pseudomonas savastanoi]
MNYKKALGALALLLIPTLALAHPGHGDNGLIAGISHPIGGLDHLLAMLAVGLWAAQQQGSARWALPCTFVGTMLIGGVLGFEGLNLPALESGIAASVLALGLAVALAVRPPLALAVAATALFALFHGVAHGLELPDMSSPWAYAAGFVAATAACMRQVMPWFAYCLRRQHRWCASQVQLLRQRVCGCWRADRISGWSYPLRLEKSARVDQRESAGMRYR